MHDAVTLIGTAIVGGLILDLQRRLSARQLIMAGLVLLPLGWTLMLGMSASGPFPFQAGAAIGCGILLTGIALLSLPAFRARRATRDSGRSRNN
ncbi:MAG TPA: hypothetical protein VF475_15080 [Sphingobium sp.]